MKPFWKTTSYILLVANIAFMLIIPMILDLLKKADGISERMLTASGTIAAYLPIINTCLLLMLIVSYMTWQAEDT